MRVAWVTHHLPGPRSESGLLPGEFVGGAEMCDFGMVSAAPEGVTVDWIGPNEWTRAFDYDRVVVTGTDMLTAEACRELAEVRPVVWVHHEQSRSDARAYLFGMADPFVCMSDLHAERETAWSGAPAEVCHGWVDLAGAEPAVKEDWALWAARDHPFKGRAEARLWAQQAGVELREITNRPRAEVIEAMTRARWFVFLPHVLDACPRTLIEAEAAGCEIVTNERAGRRRPGNVREVNEAQKELFWRWV